MPVRPDTDGLVTLVFSMAERHYIMEEGDLLCSEVGVKLASIAALEPHGATVVCTQAEHEAFLHDLARAMASRGGQPGEEILRHLARRFFGRR